MHACIRAITTVKFPRLYRCLITLTILVNMAIAASLPECNPRTVEGGCHCVLDWWEPLMEMCFPCSNVCRHGADTERCYTDCPVYARTVFEETTPVDLTNATTTTTTGPEYVNVMSIVDIVILVLGSVVTCIGLVCLARFCWRRCVRSHCWPVTKPVQETERPRDHECGVDMGQAIGDCRQLSGQNTSDPHLTLQPLMDQLQSDNDRDQDNSTAVKALIIPASV